MTNEDKFWKNVSVLSEDECWNWKKCCLIKNGKPTYGQASYLGKRYSANRLAYILTYGEIDKTIFLTHTCGNFSCCNPKHMKPFSNINTADKFWSLVKKTEDITQCWLWQGYCDQEYGQFNFEGKKQGAHRLSYMFSNNLTVIDKNMFVCHRCDNPPCCNPNHLFLGTPDDNVQDKMQKGRYKPGGILTKEQADEIRVRCNLEYIAKEYRVSLNTVLEIIQNKRWT